MTKKARRAMDVKEILSTWLKDHGFDGLAGDDCGCFVDDLIACGEDPSNCEPGYKCGCPGNCEFAEYGCFEHVTTTRPKPKKRGGK